MFSEFEFPENVWLGTSISKSSNDHRLEDLTSCGCKYTTFVLVEPLLGPMTRVDFCKIDLLFVGALTGPGAKPPSPEWMKSISHHNITWKENIKKYL